MSNASIDCTVNYDTQPKRNENKKFKIESFNIIKTQQTAEIDTKVENVWETNASTVNSVFSLVKA